MDPSQSSPVQSLTSPHRWWSRISSFFGEQTTLELPTHSDRIVQPSVESSEPRNKHSWSGNATGKSIPGKESPTENYKSEEEPVQAHSPERGTSEDEISQRPTPRRSLDSDEHSAYREGSILSGKQFASPLTDSAMRPLVPRAPTQGDRYTRERSPPDPMKGSEVVFRSGPRPIPKINNLPDDWVEDVHPEGQLLYSQILRSRDLEIRVHTDLALRDTENHLLIKNAIERLLESLNFSTELHDAGLEESDVEACILVRKEFPDEFGYYLVNHQEQTVFWLEEVTARDIDMWAYDEDMYRHKLAEEYWRHVTDFPRYCSLSPKVWEQLGPLMLLGAVDHEYCEDSTAPSDAQTLSRLESYWRQTKDQRDNDVNKAACNWICARLWYDFVTIRIENFWGTDYSRLERGIAVVAEPQPSQVHQRYSWFIKFVCLFLLWDEPAATMRLLDGAWSDGIMYPKLWRDTISMFSQECEKIFISSTVTFAGAMAFLSIPLQIQQGGTDPTVSQNPSLLASFALYCGIACCAFSVASLIAATRLKRDFGGNIARDVHEAGAYLRNLYSDSLGYLKWGICLSLPRVLFQWAIVWFCAGLAIVALQLHQSQMQFFYAEASMVIILVLAVFTGIYLSPETFRRESKLRKTAFTTRDTFWGATRRTGILVWNWIFGWKVLLGHNERKSSLGGNKNIRSTQSRSSNPSHSSRRKPHSPKSTNNNMIGLQFPVRLTSKQRRSTIK